MHIFIAVATLVIQLISPSSLYMIDAYNNPGIIEYDVYELSMAPSNPTIVGRKLPLTIYIDREDLTLDVYDKWSGTLIEYTLALSVVVVKDGIPRIGIDANNKQGVVSIVYSQIDNNVVILTMPNAVGRIMTMVLIPNTGFIDEVT